MTHEDRNPLVLKFEPRTIEHLGVRMYSTLPPALAELISNAYDADAENVFIKLNEDDGIPLSIKVTDDGTGMCLDDIVNKFLVIGRNRRDEGDEPSPKFGRFPTGKKGLGKLALFGLAKKITIITTSSGITNTFTLDYDVLTQQTGTYQPNWEVRDEQTTAKDGTSIELKELKRKSSFDIEALAKSLARIFIFDSNFHLKIEDVRGNSVAVDNLSKYAEIDKEFEWTEEFWRPQNCEYPNISGQILSAQKPISPKSGLRGITIYSRGKLVNAPEFFSESTSSHFYQYVTGYIIADFIDLLPEDVISTNRQSLDWDHPETIKFRKFLRGVVSQVSASWRQRRKEKKDLEITEATGGIDKEIWMSKLPEDVRNSANSILNLLGNDESVERIAPVVKELHKIIPEYPRLHWRHLHPRLQAVVKSYYENKQYGEAAQQGCLEYLQFLREKSGMTTDGRALVDPIFTYAKSSNRMPKLQITKLSNESEENIQEGHAHFSRGLVTGFRNPIQHAPIYTMVPDVFAEIDCLNILSLVSYLMEKVDGASVN